MEKAAAAALFAQTDQLRTQATAIRSVPGENRVEGPVKIGDGVLDVLVNAFNGTVTTVSSSVSPSVYGQPVTFTATVTTALPGGSIPNPTGGIVQFRRGTTNLGSPVPIDENGQAQLTTSTLPRTTSSISAVYSGDAVLWGSSSASISQVVSRASTTTTVTSSLNPSAFGQPVTFTATVEAVAPGSGIPTGNVTFRIDGSSVGSRTLSNGVATYTTSSLAVGSHTVTATYAQSANYLASTSPVYIQNVE